MCLQTCDMEDEFPMASRKMRQVPCGDCWTKSLGLARHEKPGAFSRVKRMPIVCFLYQTMCHVCYVVLCAMGAENTPVPTPKVQMQSHLCPVRLSGRDKRMRSSSCYEKHLSIRALSLLVQRKRRHSLLSVQEKCSQSTVTFSATFSSRSQASVQLNFTIPPITQR